MNSMRIKVVTREIPLVLIIRTRGFYLDFYRYGAKGHKAPEKSKKLNYRRKPNDTLRRTGCPRSDRTGNDEEEIKELINNGKAVFYIGFDPTADSLHVGHFMALCLMKRLQMAGNKPIALIGGGTAMIGDPSGRTDMRQMMTPETIQHNVDCFKKQMSRFIDFGEGKAMLVNNADWLMDLNYIDVLRDVGAHFRKPHADSRMLQAAYGKRIKLSGV